MNKDEPGFQYIKNKFLNISDAKRQEGIFIGPKTTQLPRDAAFLQLHCSKERIA